jgi:hypothetical protein
VATAESAAPLIATIRLARPSRPRTAGFLLAGLGGVAALVAYFALPLATLTYSVDFGSLFSGLGGAGGSSSDPSSLGSSLGLNLCGQSGCAMTATAAQGFGTSGPSALAVLPFLAALALVLALFPTLRNRTAGLLTPRDGAVACILASALGGLVLWSQVSNTQSNLNSSMSELSSLVKVSSQLSYGVGFWVLAGGLALTLIGGGVALVFSRAE